MFCGEDKVFFYFLRRRGVLWDERGCFMRLIGCCEREDVFCWKEKLFCERKR